MDATPILVAWSGGKDCLLALDRLRRDPAWRVVALLTTVDKDYRRVMTHGTSREVLRAQARALGLPVLEVALEWGSTNKIYEAAHARALAEARMRWPGIRHCAFGDLFLEDVREYRIRQLGRESWRAVFPLWGADTATLARRFIHEGHQALICCVDTQQLDPALCGRPFDQALLDRLPPGIDPCGERGEFHTLSWAGPMFAQALRLRRGESVLRDGHFQCTDFLLEAPAAT